MHCRSGDVVIFPSWENPDSGMTLLPASCLRSVNNAPDRQCTVAPRLSQESFDLAGSFAGHLPGGRRKGAGMTTLTGALFLLLSDTSP